MGLRGEGRIRDPLRGRRLDWALNQLLYAGPIVAGATMLDHFDDFNEFVFAGGSKGIGRFFWKIGDVTLIDGLVVNGSAKMVGWWSTILRRIQTGYLYHYAFAMIIGLLALLSWYAVR